MFIYGSFRGLSKAVLKSGTNLPEVFTMCASVKEPISDGKSFFVIYQAEDKLWITFSNWLSALGNELWVNTGNDAYLIQTLDIQSLIFWINLCFSLDIKSGETTVSINGNSPIMIKTSIPSLPMPSDLKDMLVLGISDYNRGETDQFIGEIANIKILNGTKDVQKLSADLCNQYGDVLDIDAEWVTSGSVKKITKESWEICNSYKNTYIVPIKTDVTFHEGVKICNNLASGKMKLPVDEKDLQNTLSIFKEVKIITCTGLWIPLSDSEEEGVFRNIYNGKQQTFLPWDMNRKEPDGGEQENFLVVNLKTEKFGDENEN